MCGDGRLFGDFRCRSDLKTIEWRTLNLGKRGLESDILEKGGGFNGFNHGRRRAGFSHDLHSFAVELQLYDESVVGQQLGQFLKYQRAEGVSHFLAGRKLASSADLPSRSRSASVSCAAAFA